MSERRKYSRCCQKQQIPSGSGSWCAAQDHAPNSHLCATMGAASVTLSICLPNLLLDHPGHLRPHNVCETLQPLLERTMTGFSYLPSEPLGSPQEDRWWQWQSQGAARKNLLKHRGWTQPIAGSLSTRKENFHAAQRLPCPLMGSRFFFLLFILPCQAQQNLGLCCERCFAKTHTPPRSTTSSPCSSIHV